MTANEKRRLSAHVARISLAKAYRWRDARRAYTQHKAYCPTCKRGDVCSYGDVLTDNIPRLTWTRPGDWRDSNAERA